MPTSTRAWTLLITALAVAGCASTSPEGTWVPSDGAGITLTVSRPEGERTQATLRDASGATVEFPLTWSAELDLWEGPSPRVVLAAPFTVPASTSTHEERKLEAGDGVDVVLDLVGGDQPALIVGSERRVQPDGWTDAQRAQFVVRNQR